MEILFLTNIFIVLIMYHLFTCFKGTVNFLKMLQFCDTFTIKVPSSEMSFGVNSFGLHALLRTVTSNSVSLSFIYQSTNYQRKKETALIFLLVFTFFSPCNYEAEWKFVGRGNKKHFIAWLLLWKVKNL